MNKICRFYKKYFISFKFWFKSLSKLVELWCSISSIFFVLFGKIILNYENYKNIFTFTFTVLSFICQFRCLYHLSALSRGFSLFDYSVFSIPFFISFLIFFQNFLPLGGSSDFRFPFFRFPSVNSNRNNKVMSLCHKFSFCKTYIFATLWCKLLIFQTYIIWSNSIHSSKY